MALEVRTFWRVVEIVKSFALAVPISEEWQMLFLMWLCRTFDARHRCSYVFKTGGVGWFVSRGCSSLLWWQRSV